MKMARKLKIGNSAIDTITRASTTLCRHTERILRNERLDHRLPQCLAYICGSYKLLLPKLPECRRPWSFSLG
jgi:hypothetical protein